MHELPRTRQAIARGIEQNLHPGGQVYVWRAGRVLGELALGEARPGVPMTVDHLLPWMSGTKPLVAAAVMQCVQRGLFGLDDPVARHIPEFAQHGKQDITLRHLLTHTAGLRTAPVDRPEQSWDQIIAAICAAPPEPNWPAGTRAGYHPGSSWFVLGEVVRRADGRMIDRYVDQEIFQPLEMSDSALSLAGRADLAERSAMVYQTDGRRMSANPASVEMRELSRLRPGASGRGPARELGRFYQMLLAGGTLGGRVLDPASVREMIRRQRQGMLDETFRQVMDWGLGLIINTAGRTPLSVLPYNFGPGASAEAFGHGGAQSSISFADPARRVVAVILLNGMPGEGKHHARMAEILQALWMDIDGLSGPA